MRARLVKNRHGRVCGATVTLTERERALVLARRVPMIYSPGGLGPDEPVRSNTVSFGGACYVDLERKLPIALDAFRAALRAATTRRP